MIVVAVKHITLAGRMYRPGDVIEVRGIRGEILLREGKVRRPEERPLDRLATR